MAFSAQGNAHLAGGTINKATFWGAVPNCSQVFGLRILIRPVWVHVARAALTQTILMINRCFPAEIGHYYFSGWLHSCTHFVPRATDILLKQFVCWPWRAHTRKCVFYIPNPFQTISPRVTAALINHLQSESRLCWRRKKESEKKTHSPATCVWPLMAPIVLRALFNCFSQTSFNLLFISCARKPLCEGAQIQLSARSLSGFKHDVICIHAFKILSSAVAVATDFLAYLHSRL